MPSNTVVAEYGREMVVTDAALPVVETFHSLQGEGVHTGRSAFFIRLGGCSVGCSWCDTKHSWPQAPHPTPSTEELGVEAGQAAAAGAAFVVITGGEPLHHQLDGLCEALRDQISLRIGTALPLHLETSGVDPLSGSFDWITLSPKRHRPPTTELLAQCDELKVIVHDAEDLTFAEAMADRAAQARNSLKNRRTSEPWLMLQPGHGSDEGAAIAIEYVKANPQWRLSLQTHKLLGIN
jgi:organic radical activating enzyme